ncbi:MAG: insulinase family protein [Deltaproteobacteria bacterium]|nr:insulinase family protein [Deltaproteobacteria bacterium]
MAFYPHPNRVLDMPRLFGRILFIFIILFVATGISPAEETSSSIDLDVKEFKLDNGMHFLVVERSAMPQVACRIAIRAGSALEESGKTGIAHLLEHMMFKGTKNFGTLDFKKDKSLQDQIEAAYQRVLEEEKKRHPDRQLIRDKLAEMDALRLEVQKIYVPQAFSSQLSMNGAVRINAFTSKDQTQYMTSVPSDMIEQWFSIISEQLFEPSWREFYVEKEVVQREWAFRYVNNPSGAAWLDLESTAYRAHPYRNPTIGWKADMEKYNTHDAMAFHKRYYNPANAVCVLVGDITLEKARQLAKIYFDRYSSGHRAPESVTDEPPQSGPRKSIRYLKGVRTPLVRVGYHTARMGTDDFYALDAMTMILSHGRGARMTQDIVNKGLAVEAWAYNPDNRYGGMVILGGSPNEPEGLKSETLNEGEIHEIYVKACEDLKDILIGEVARLKKEPVSRRELDRIKKLNQRDFLDRLKSNEQLAGTLASLEVQVGWRYLNTYLDRIAAVTPEDIMKVARHYFQAENVTTAYIIPGGASDRKPEQYREIRSLSGLVAAKNVVRPGSYINHSMYPTPRNWKHPLSFTRRPEKIMYPKAEIEKINDTALFFMQDRELPLIDLSILVKAGAVDVPDDKIGLTQILNGSLIRGGTEDLSPNELAMILDENAIRLSVAVGEEVSKIHLSVMKEDWNKGLEVLKEILTRPGFNRRVLAATKQQLLTALSRQRDDAGAVSGREAAIWHFKGHPYGRDPLGGLKTIPSIDETDLKSFLQNYFVPRNMVMALSGDIGKHEGIEGLRKLVKALPETTPPPRQLAEPAETPPVLALIHKPGQVQSQVNIRLPGVRRTRPEYWRLSLLMHLFGGNDSLLYTRLRDDLGLVYAAWAYQTYKWKAGLLVGYIGCKGNQTADALRESVKIMQSLHEGIPAGRLDQKRLDVLNSFVFNVDTPAELVEVYSRYHMRHEPLDTLERIQDAYMKAGEEDLRQLANRFLDPNRLQIFVVGDENTLVKKADGEAVTLKEDLMMLAGDLGLPFKEIALR